MRFGFCELVNPATKVSEVDLEATRAHRECVREEVLMHRQLRSIIDLAHPGDGTVRFKWNIRSVPEEEFYANRERPAS